MTLSEARSLLAKFGLGAGEVERAARTLSAGERTRAILALLMAQGVNCLVLDEPTNHLDLAAIEQLEQAVAGYDGTLLLVTQTAGCSRRSRSAVSCGSSRGRWSPTPRSETGADRAATVDKSDTSCVRRQPTWRRSPSSTPSSSSTVTR